MLVNNTLNIKYNIEYSIKYLMANKGGRAKGSNKLKRKRGKKFRFYEGEGAGASAVGKGKQADTNPFEDHHSSRKAAKDKLKVCYNDQ